MRRLIAAIGVILILTASGVATAAAQVPTPATAASAPGRALGIVPVLDKAKGARPTRTSNLSYHGGPVMAAGNRTYAIYWGPAGSWDSGYTTTIDQFFTDVAADSSTGSSPAKQSNVYWSDTQYSSIKYTSTYAGSVSDTNPYPANGCTDKATAICLSDAQLRTELLAVMAVNQWTASSGGVQNLFFMFTPKGVGSCTGSSCAYTSFCAYHWAIPAPNSIGSEPILYANQPYAAQGYQIYTCDSGQHPNGTTADATLNVVSHEHNEAITDEQGSAWYDSQGNENGDKCAWNFGTALGTASNGAKYNQLINGDSYYLQQEWSNASKGCVLKGS